MDSTPRLFVVNAWTAAAIVVIQASLFAVVLGMLGVANERAWNASRYVGQLDGQIAQCVRTIHEARDVYGQCRGDLALSQRVVVELDRRCGL